MAAPVTQAVLAGGVVLLETATFSVHLVHLAERRRQGEDVRGEVLVLPFVHFSDRVFLVLDNTVNILAHLLNLRSDVDQVEVEEERRRTQAREKMEELNSLFSQLENMSPENFRRHRIGELQSFRTTFERFSVGKVEPMTFVYISPGTFLMGSPESEAGRMGSPESEAGRWSDEGPQHRVTLTRGFEIQRTEVTQCHWFSVMGNNPSRFDHSFHCSGEHVTLQGTALCPNHPVERVSWNDIQTFLSRLNNRVGEGRAITTVFRQRQSGSMRLVLGLRQPILLEIIGGAESIWLVLFEFWGTNSISGEP